MPVSMSTTTGFAAGVENAVTIQLQRKHIGHYCLCYLDRDINLNLGVLSSF